MIPDRIIKSNKIERPVLYLSKNISGSNQAKQLLYSNSGPFYMMTVVILFVCFGMLLNIGLKVHNINYQKEIFKLNEMISL